MTGTEKKNENDFSIKMSRDTFKKIMYWVLKGEKAKHEVSGFCPVEFDDKVFTLKDPFLLEQKCSSGDTEIDPVALGKAEFDHRADPMGLKCHWHSHPNMGVFFSHTDKQLIKQLGNETWLLALVFNEKYEIKTGLIYNAEFLDIKTQYFVEDIPVRIIDTVDERQIVAWDKEFEDNVKNESTVVQLPKSKNTSKTYMSSFAELSIKKGNKKLTKKEKLIADHILTYVGFIMGSSLFTFSDTGLAFSHKRQSTLYNPVCDKSVRGKNNILKAIIGTEFHDVIYLIETSPTYREFIWGNLEALDERGLFDAPMGYNSHGNS